MALRKLQGSKRNIKKPPLSGLYGQPTGPTSFNPVQVDIPSGVNPPGMLDPYNIENAPPGFTVADIIRDVQLNGGNINDAVTRAKEFGVVAHEGSDGPGYQELQDEWAKQWRKLNPEEPVEYDRPPLPFDSPQVMQMREEARSKDYTTVSNRVGQEDGWWSDDQDTEKSPLTLPPLQSSNSKMPGEQHPGVDYSSVDKPLQDKRQDRLGLFSTQKESETYGNGIYGGGSVTEPGVTAVNADPTWEAPKADVASGNSLIEQVYTSFKNAGFNTNQAKALVAEVGRENSFKESLVYGSHKDPKNKATNVGFFSWQGSRAPKVMDALEKAGVVNEDGSIEKGQKALDTMAKFARSEMKNYPTTMKDFVNNPNGSYEDYYKTLGDDYIRWARNDPKYADAGAKNRDHFYNKIDGKVSNQSVPVGGDPANMLSRPGDYGFEKNRGFTDVQALERQSQGMFDAAYPVGNTPTPQSTAEAHQTMDGHIAQMGQGVDPRGNQIAPTPGANPPHYEHTLDQHNVVPDQLEGHHWPNTIYNPADYTNNSPVTPTVVPIETFTLPTEGEEGLAAGARGAEPLSDPATQNQEQGLRPHYDPAPERQYRTTDDILDRMLEMGKERMQGSSSRNNLGGGATQQYGVGGGQTRAADDLQNYQQYMQQPPSPMNQFNNYPAGPAAGRGEPQYPNNTYEIANDRRLEGDMNGFPTTYQSPTQQGLQDGTYSPKALETYFPGYTGNDFEAPVIPTAQNTRTYGSKKEQETYGRNFTRPTTTYKSVPVYDYVNKGGSYSYDDSDWGLDPESMEELGLGDIFDPRGDQIKPVKEIVGYKQVPVTTPGTTQKGKSGSSERSGIQSSRLTSSPYATSRTQGILQAATGQQPGRPEKDLISNITDKLAVNLSNPGKKDLAKLAGLISNPVAVGGGAVAKGLFDTLGQSRGIYNNNGTGTPSLGGATQLGSAYGVYADRSDRDTYAVANSGAVVSRDANSGWTGVTSNVNGNGPVTTMTIPLPGGGSTQSTQKIVCTAMNEDYGFGSYRNAIWLKYAEDNLTDYHEKGYHAIFKPLLKLGREKSPKLYAALKHIARHRTADLRAEMKNNGKRDTLGRSYRAVLEPVCYIVGRMLNGWR